MTLLDDAMQMVEPTSEEEYLASAQRLISSGQGWKLEGSVGRGLMSLIDNGRAVLGPVAHPDYWGYRIPSRYEVQPGTKGSVEYAGTTEEAVLAIEAGS